MEGFNQQVVNTEGVHKKESFEIAEKAALEKLESLLGEKPLEQFSVRFMNMERV